MPRQHWKPCVSVCIKSDDTDDATTNEDEVTHQQPNNTRSAGPGSLGTVPKQNHRDLSLSIEARYSMGKVRNCDLTVGTVALKYYPLFVYSWFMSYVGLDSFAPHQNPSGHREKLYDEKLRHQKEELKQLLEERQKLIEIQGKIQDLQWSCPDLQVFCSLFLSLNLSLSF